MSEISDTAKSARFFDGQKERPDLAVAEPTGFGRIRLSKPKLKLAALSAVFTLGPALPTLADPSAAHAGTPLIASFPVGRDFMPLTAYILLIASFVLSSLWLGRKPKATRVALAIRPDGRRVGVLMDQAEQPMLPLRPLLGYLMDGLKSAAKRVIALAGGASRTVIRLAALASFLPFLGEYLRVFSTPQVDEMMHWILVSAIGMILTGMGALMTRILWPFPIQPRKRFQFSIMDLLKLPSLFMLLAGYLQYGVLNFTNFRDVNHLFQAHPLDIAVAPDVGRAMLRYAVYIAASLAALGGIAKLEKPRQDS